MIPSDCEANTGWLRRLWDFFLQPLRDADEESRLYLSSPAGRQLDYKVWVILLTTAIVLTLQHYVGGWQAVEWAAKTSKEMGYDEGADWIFEALSDPVYGQLYYLLIWVTARFLGWLVLPMLIIKLVFRERIRDYGTKLKGVLDGAPLYGIMLLIMLPLVVYFSFDPAFRSYYPYYKPEPSKPLWPAFWIWEAAYLFHFFIAEFFFRGFLVHGLRRRLGSYSILVMTVPYCMIHLGKPLPEAFGSIIAGIALGFMSLKTRSVWLGTAVHVTVAVTMDMLALYHLGRFS